MFINHIYRHAGEHPDTLAVINSGEEITYRRFANSIEAVRNFLMRARLPGDGVIVNITSNLYYDWVQLLALRSLGHTTVSGTSWEVIERLDVKDIVGLVCLSDQTGVIEAFRNARPDCAIVEVSRSLATGGNGNPPPLLPDGLFGDHIVYTSGTTGNYKKVKYSGEGLLDLIASESLAKAGQIMPGEVYYGHSFGPWTAAGQRMSASAWVKGATVIFEQRKDWTGHFFDYPIDMTFFVPALLDEVSRQTRPRSASGPKMRILAGGGFMNAELARKVVEKFDCELIIAYGGTEFRTSLDTVFRTDDDVIWLPRNEGSDLEIVSEDGRPVQVGVEGIVRVRCGPGQATGYLDDPEATMKHFRDGYFYPGDMAVQREDGRIRILGRVDDVLNLGGQKIAIKPFEDWARKTLGVENLCAFNQQDDDGKEMLVVVIEGSELPARDRLQAVARKVSQVPKVRFALINAFPRGDNGMMKINRRKVLELARETFKKPVASA